MSAPLWTVEAMAQAMGARARRARCRRACRDFRSTPAPFSRARRSSRSRTRRDGHDFVEAALKAGGGLAVVAADKRGMFPKRCAAAGRARCARRRLIALARAARARSTAKFIGVTGSVGKTGTKEALRLALSSDGETHASAASYNNHWGVPLSLARCPTSARYAVLEMGMNHAGEIAPLTQARAARMSRSSPRSSRCISNFSPRSRRSPTPRRKFSTASSRAAPRCINRDNPHFARLQQRGEGGRRRRASSRSASTPSADARLLKFALQPELLDRAGAHPRRRRHLQARRARPPSGDEFAGGAGGGDACRRRSGARRAGARRISRRRAGRGERHHARASRRRRRC